MGRSPNCPVQVAMQMFREVLFSVMVFGASQKADPRRIGDLPSSCSLLVAEGEAKNWDMTTLLQKHAQPTQDASNS